ncbi:AmmeMemoRadiSam system radical SAM enzyme [bacterium]|nr:AmmeMemoRadiSam system radical SAM enzyme [bacterium]
MSEQDRNKVDRRSFLKTGGLMSCMGWLHVPELTGMLTGLTPAALPEHRDQGGLVLPLKEAMFYTKLPDGMVQCEICPRECRVAKQERGYCGVKVNYDGKYYTLVHSRPCSVNIDPIEKKPLFHYLPQSAAFSLATAGCNMMCKYCQNWQISQVRPEQVKNYDLSPQKVIALCKERQIASVAFTYSEPVIFYEYMLDIAKLGKDQGVKTVMISNGFIKPGPMEELARYLTAVKIDFKAFNEKFYAEVCAGHLQPVLENLILLHRLKIWFELVYLVVPTLNDSVSEFERMCTWIVSELGADVPLHLSRFYPQYQLTNVPPTPISQLDMARNIALEAGIRYVYIGNVPRHEAENTYCPKCHKKLIERRGYAVTMNVIKIKDDKGFCPDCQTEIAGIWS